MGNKQSTPSFTEARELLRYDPETGELFWLPQKGKGRTSTEKPAGSQKNDGYIRVTINYREYPAHRVGWLLHYGRWPTLDIDHINGIKNDNRISNLREVTDSENQQNLKRPSAGNKTGYLGVCYYRGKYLANIKLNGKQHRLGKFDCPKTAHEAYLNAKRQLHPASTIT